MTLFAILVFLVILLAALYWWTHGKNVDAGIRAIVGAAIALLVIWLVMTFILHQPTSL